ncbi:16192_t:CDS:2, partial [Racocetra persica]
TEIRITNDTIMCYNREGEPILFEFSQEITTISLEQARMSLYLNNLKRIDIPTRSLEEVSLLQCYYLLGEWLEAQFGVQLLEPSRVYQLYHTRGTHNLLTVQNITANALLRLSDENFKALIEEARLLRAAE